MDPGDYNLTSANTTLDYNDRSSYQDHETRDDIENIDEIIEMIKNVSFTLYGIIFILGIIGNGLVIWIAGFRMKKTISAVWFLNLAIADLLSCASLPLRIAEWFCYHQKNDFSDLALCICNIILFTLNMSASVLLLTAMSIDRWVSVMWPFWAKVHRTQKLVKITAGIIWVMGLLITGVVLYFYLFYFIGFSEWCVLPFTFDPYNIKDTVQLTRLVVMFVIPFLIIFTSYVTIFLKLRKSKRPQRSQRPYRIITAVILCFFICWAPYYIWPLINEYSWSFLQYSITNSVVISLAFLNSCINPIIYVFMGHDFRHNFLRSIPFRLEKALGEPTNDPHGEGEDIAPTQTTDP
ncbi:C5a anaphylatoxin chemotactic receptor 1-like [Engystomops pustulosus]|uniref:C5a anaphylatoxin chemotactic receptor 1-like n=1 Tax=Engystomops pustulosus TaxID=76066 RepID=UPI003AFA2ADD